MGGSCHLCSGAKRLKPDLACRPGGAFSAFTQLDPRHHKKGLLNFKVPKGLLPFQGGGIYGQASWEQRRGAGESEGRNQRSVGTCAGRHKLYVTGYGSWQGYTCTMFFKTKSTPFINSDFFFLFLTSRFLAFCTSLATPAMLGLGLHVVALGQKG